MQRRVLGLILIGIGVIIYAGGRGWMSGDAFLYTVAAIFLLSYFMSGYRVGLLIPGCMLGALGAFVTITERYPHLSGSGAPFFLLIGTGFMVIFLLEYGLARRGVWAAWTAIPILVFGGLLYLGEVQHISVGRILIDYWPALLIAVGAILLLQSWDRGRRRS